MSVKPTHAANGTGFFSPAKILKTISHISLIYIKRNISTSARKFALQGRPFKNETLRYFSDKNTANYSIVFFHVINHFKKTTVMHFKSSIYQRMKY